MNSYFEEKADQVNYDGTMRAFGIEIISRYNAADELVSMLELATRLANHNLHTRVTTLFYDSKAAICDIQCESSLAPHDKDAQTIEQCARQHLTAFMLFGEDMYSEQVPERTFFIVK